MEKISSWQGFRWPEYYSVLNTFSTARKVSLSLSFAFLTALSAQIYIRFPFTPVPFTGQVFTVLLAGVILGRKFGSLSQLFYLAGGAAGINWFAAGGAGFMRPTTGYIAGFILAVYLIGFFAENAGSRKKLFAGMFFGILLIHLSGVLWLSSYMRIPFYRAFTLGSLPFLPFDAIKALIAGHISGKISQSGDKI